MKKKSVLKVFNAKLALMLIAVCGMFVSCYEKEEIDVPQPVPPTAPTYAISGVITNSQTGEPLESATIAVGGESSNATTGSDGVYSISIATPGAKTVTITKDKFKKFVAVINVEAVATGNKTYVLNAGLLSAGSGDDDKDDIYKKVQYVIIGNAYNEDAATVNIKSVLMNNLTSTVNEASFTTAPFSTPGEYRGLLIPEGDTYKKLNFAVYVRKVDAEKATAEGEIQTEEQSFNLILEKVPTPPTPPAGKSYWVSGSVADEAGTAIKGAVITIQSNTMETPLIVKTDPNGFYKKQFPSDKVTAFTLVRVTIEATDYETVSFVKSMPEVPVGEVGIISEATQMKKAAEGEEPTPGEEVTQPGNGEVPQENTVSTKVEGDVKNETDVENALKKTAEETGMTDEDAEAAAKLIAEMAKEGTVIVSEDIKVVPVTDPIPFSVVSKVADANGSAVVVEEDNIEIAKNSQIIYPDGKAQNISVDRKISEEKNTTALRVFEGTPSGAIFTTPMKVTVQAPTGISAIDAPDFEMPVLYWNEKNSAWEADAKTYAKYENGNFVADIQHFSKFKFGFPSNDGSKWADRSDSICKRTLKEPFWTDPINPATVSFKLNLPNGYVYPNGQNLKSIIKAQAGTLNNSSIAYIEYLITRMIKLYCNNVTPSSSYTTVDTPLSATIEADKKVLGFNVTAKRIERTFTLSLKDKTISVTVYSITGYEKAEPITEMGHGHGHGNDWNAGGGVVEVE